MDQTKQIDVDDKGDEKARNTDMESFDLTAEDEIFLRRSSIARTPPGRNRVNSLPETWKMAQRVGKSKRRESSDGEKSDEERDAEQINKRKKAEATETTKKEYLKIVNILMQHIDDLHRITRDSRNTKVDIKDIAEKAKRLTTKLKSEGMKRAWDYAAGPPPEQMAQELALLRAEQAKTKDELEALRKKLQENAEAKTRRSSIGTQTEAAEIRKMELKKDQEQAKAKLIEAVRKGGGYEEFEKISDLKWSEDVFDKVGESWEEIMKIPRTWDLAVLATADFKLETGAARTLTDWFQGIDDLEEQGAEVGEIAYLTDTITVTKKSGEKSESSRLIMYGMVAENAVDPWNPREVFKCIEALRDKERRKVVLAGSDKYPRTALKKIVEFVFAGSPTQIQIVHDPTVREKKQPLGERPPRPPRSRDDVIIVEAGTAGTSYADLLRNLKSKVDPAGMKADITGVRKTRAGDLLIALKKGGEDNDKLLREISSKVGRARTMGREKKTTVHISGLDAVTTGEDVKKAVMELVGMTEAEMQPEKVALWPAYGERQNASLTLPKQKSQELCKKGRIRVGWISCPVRERVEVATCYRCWEEGHERAECKGVDRSNRCHRCGGEDHRAGDCQRAPACPLCNREGHRANSTGCPIFRSLLAKASQRAARK